MGKRLAAVAVGFLLLVAVPLVVVVKIHGRQTALHGRGVVTQAVVVGTDLREETDYLIVTYQACRCPVAVATAHAGRHPVGSVLPVRYDPDRPDRAEAMVDRPNPYGPVLLPLGSMVAVVAIAVPLAVHGFRRQRRGRALARSSTPTARVRVEPWRRSFLKSTISYVSVYRAGAPAGEGPMLCFPVAEEVAAELGDLDGADFDLFGATEPGRPVALRRDDLVVVPAGGTKSAEWEASHRRRGANVLAVAAPPSRSRPPGLLHDEHEARSYRRLARAQLLFSSLLLPVLFLRFLPDGVVFASVPFLVVVTGGVLVSGWRRRRLLDRVARRLPDAAPASRRDRRLLREEATRQLASPQGRAEAASLLGTTVDDLAATDRRAARWLWSWFGLNGVGVIVVVVALVLT